MWADLAIQGGLAALRTGVSYRAAQKEAEAKKAMQKYKNAMAWLSNANNQNNLTTNQNMLVERNVEQNFLIDRSNYITSAKAEAAAAASGVGGRSVNMVMFDIDNNAAMQHARQRDDLEAQLEGIDAQRRSSAFQAKAQQDLTYIPEPSGAAFVLGLTNDLMGKYQTYKQTK